MTAPTLSRRLYRELHPTGKVGNSPIDDPLLQAHRSMMAKSNRFDDDENRDAAPEHLPPVEDHARASVHPNSPSSPPRPGTFTP